MTKQPKVPKLATPKPGTIGAKLTRLGDHAANVGEIVARRLHGKHTQK